jgi:imidazolonepropionase-like amidohydrolase
MPTLVLQATADSLDVPNPWNAPSSALIKASDLDTPVDKATGMSGYLAKAPEDRREAVRKCAQHIESLDARFYQLGARFLAGSISPSYGIMPGSGLHEELSLLHRIGLLPREAVAAATSNYADVYPWKDVGRIEPGRMADILILDDDPRVATSALDHINMLIFDGSVVDRKSLLEGIKQN